MSKALKTYVKIDVSFGEGDAIPWKRKFLVQRVRVITWVFLTRHAAREKSVKLKLKISTLLIMFYRRFGNAAFFRVQNYEGNRLKVKKK